MESAEETSRKMQALCASFLLLAVCTLFFVVGLSLALNFTKYEGNSDLTEELSAGIKVVLFHPTYPRPTCCSYGTTRGRRSAP